MKKKVTDMYMHNRGTTSMLPVFAAGENAFHHIPVGETPDGKKFSIE